MESIPLDGNILKTQKQRHHNCNIIVRLTSLFFVGDLSLTAVKAPTAADINMVSGDVKLYLPKNASFTLDLDSVSGSFSCDIPAKQDDKKYIFADGTNLYKINTTSGDVIIKANK